MDFFCEIAVSDHASKCQPCQSHCTHTHTHTQYANNYTVRLLTGSHLFTDAVKTGEYSTKIIMHLLSRATLFFHAFILW